MRHHLFRAIIGQRQRRAAIGHKLFSALHHSGERIDRNIHRHFEIRGACVHIAATQFVFIGKSNGVNDEIETAPFVFEGLKNRV